MMIFMDSAIDGLLYLVWATFCLKVSEACRYTFEPLRASGQPELPASGGIWRQSLVRDSANDRPRLRAWSIRVAKLMT